MHSNLIYRKSRLKMKSKRNTAPGKVKFFTKVDIEAFIRKKAEVIPKHQTYIQAASKRFALERDKNAKPAWCYMTKKKYYCIPKEPTKIGKPLFSL